jgi:hypothetical protein
MTLAMVNVLPEPVTPKSTWEWSPRSSPSVNWRIASGWSPVGLYFDVSLKFAINFGVQRYGKNRIIKHDKCKKSSIFNLQTSIFANSLCYSLEKL